MPGLYKHLDQRCNILPVTIRVIIAIPDRGIGMQHET